MPKHGCALFGWAGGDENMKPVILRFLKLGGLGALALVALLTAFGPAPADARVFVRVGIGGPYYYGYPAYSPYYYYPPYPPYYYAPPPAAYAPPPVGYSPYATPPAAYAPPSGPAYSPYATPPGYASPYPQQ